MSSSSVPCTTEIDTNSVTHVLNNIDASASENTVWNTPVNGAEDVIPVIAGADLWPSLSEGVNTRIKPSYRIVPESPLSLISNDSSSSSRKIVGRGWRSYSSQNGTHSGSNRQPKNSAGRSNGERSHQNRQSSQGQVTDVSVKNGSHNGNSQLEAGQTNGPRPELNIGGNRKVNGGPPRGDGSHGRIRGVDRDVNAHLPNFNGRVPVQPPVFPPLIPIPRPALPIAPYPPISPPPFHPMPYVVPGIPPFAGGRVLFVHPVGPISMRPHPQFRPVGPPITSGKLCKQIEYYFSDENLVKDVHLRRNMDEHGWVMVNTIAEFNKVQQLIAPVEQFLVDNKIDPLWFVLNAVLNSYNVEVKGNKLRKRIDWKKYILPNSTEASSTASESNGQTSSAAAEIYANGDQAKRLQHTVIESKLISSDSRMEAEDEGQDDKARTQPC